MKEIIRYLIETLACSVILWGFYRLLLRHRISYAAERIYLVGSMIAAFIIPMLRIPVWAEPISGTDNAVSVIGAADAAFPAPIRSVPANTNAASLIPTLLSVLYVSGVLALSFRLLFQLWKIHRLKRAAEIEQTGDIRVIRHSQPLAPFSFLPTIYINRRTPEDLLPAILAHEESHIRHRHSRERLLIEFLATLAWWNPFLWIAAHDLEAVQEFEADHDVIARGYRPADYMEIIFKQLFGYSPDIANGLRNSLTKKRLKMMTTKRGSRYALLRLTATAPLVIALLIVFGFTTKAAEVPLQQNDNSEKLLTQTDMTPGIEAPAPEEAPLQANEVSVMPRFQEGGIDTFSDWVGRHLKYPDKKVEGMVLAQFVIRPDGTLSDIEILRSPDQTLSDAVTRVLGMSPRWTPGMKEEEPVAVKFTLPIIFQETREKAK